ncbi:kinase-like protein, partial [Schizopora paradoxa]
ILAKELTVLSEVSHPNILPFTGYVMYNNYPAIVTPWLTKGDLLKARGIAEGLTYLHSKEIVHGDLKSVRHLISSQANILLSSTNAPLIADFGMSEFMSDDSTTPFSPSGETMPTLRWSAPELLIGEEPFSIASDVWAFGMVLFELMTHEIPYFKQKIDVEVTTRIISGGHPSEGKKRGKRRYTRLALRNLRKKCWRMDPKERPAMRIVSDELNSIASFTEPVQKVDEMPMLMNEVSHR